MDEGRNGWGGNVPDEADVGEAGGGDEHVGHAAVCAGDAPDQEAVGSLKWKAGHSPQGAVEAHTGNEVE